MLTSFTKRLFSGKLFTPLGFAFGGGHHHEIDYQAVVTKNTKSGNCIIIKATTSILMKWPAELVESWLTLTILKTLKV